MFERSAQEIVPFQEESEVLPASITVLERLASPRSGPNPRGSSRSENLVSYIVPLFEKRDRPMIRHAVLFNASVYNAMFADHAKSSQWITIKVVFQSRYYARTRCTEGNNMRNRLLYQRTTCRRSTTVMNLPSTTTYHTDLYSSTNQLLWSDFCISSENRLFFQILEHSLQANVLYRDQALGRFLCPVRADRGPAGLPVAPA